MAETSSPAALVVARSTDDRILLRALLRIHHLPVVGEAEGTTQARPFLRQGALTHVVADANIADGTIADLVAEVHHTLPVARVVVLTHPGERVPDLPDGAGPRVVRLVRPFRFSQFAEALGVSSPGTGR
jgi:ActR/RegA family two-component response regulator